MKYSSKLKILSVVTIVGLGLIFFVTLFGLNNMRDTEATAHRRQSYVADFLEIKASALSTILLDPTDATTKDIFNAAEKNIAEHGKVAVGVIRREDVKAELKNILTQWSAYLDESKMIIALAATDPTKANAKLHPLYNEKYKPFLVALEKFIAIRQTESVQGVAKSQEISEEIFWEIIGLIVLVAVVNLIAVVTLSISLRSQLAGILEKLIPLKRGDLTQRIPIKEDNELGEIAADINEFVHELQTIVQHTRIRSTKLAAAAIQLSSSSASVLDSTSQQNDATSSVAASVEQFSVSIDQVSDNATQAEEKAALSGQLSITGSREVLGTISEIRKIQDVVTDASKQMQALGDQARDISGIVNVIKEVADQTNLLALNAAIEAARAGEQGRGFAVVADEVRKLAERTTASTVEISEMVSSIQQSTAAATHTMSEGNDLVTQGVRKIESAGRSIEEINVSSGQVVGSISDISQSLREQRIAGAEIAKNIERIAQMTEAGRNSASEVSCAARELEALAEELNREVEKFRV